MNLSAVLHPSLITKINFGSIYDFVTLFHLICGRRSCAGQILSQNSWGLYCKVSEVIAGKDSTWGCWWCPHCKHRHCSQRQNSWRPHSRTWLKNHILLQIIFCRMFTNLINQSEEKISKCSAAKSNSPIFINLSSQVASCGMAIRPAIIPMP